MPALVASGVRDGLVDKPREKGTVAEGLHRRICNLSRFSRRRNARPCSRKDGKLELAGGVCKPHEGFPRRHPEDAVIRQLTLVRLPPQPQPQLRGGRWRPTRGTAAHVGDERQKAAPKSLEGFGVLPFTGPPIEQQLAPGQREAPTERHEDATPVEGLTLAAAAEAPQSVLQATEMLLQLRRFCCRGRSEQNPWQWLVGRSASLPESWRQPLSCR